MNQALSKVSAKLGYQFSELDLLKTALTHRSAGVKNNERLEFLGDSILNFAIADALFERFPDIDEGRLSRLRASLVKGETLALVASGIDIGDSLLLGPGELKSGGFRRESILAGALEAIIGAAYIDGGFEESRNLILNLFKDRLDAVSIENELKDPKTRLQEYLQSRKQSLPSYSVSATEGDAHNQRFSVECKIDELDKAVMGEGSSRRKAEQDAASRVLEMIDISGSK